MKKPEISRALIQGIIDKNGVKENVVMGGIRGWDPDMGKLGVNDRGIWDDLIWLMTPTALYCVNGNTDPSRYRKGRGSGSSKGMACLNRGKWRYKPGPHNGSANTRDPRSFRQAGNVTVTRDGLNGDYEETGIFAINIHKGTVNGTSSLGCQTIHPAQWNAFRELAYAELKKYGQKEFWYILT